ncbi:MAG TPA: cytochrome c1 [Alphaproteobacteria bacterium]|nr:cytochrome c1 [Alphaproteobacteria bacterium]USO06603.1 MAG: cytochrome c1 [Rhodospirillales bacterium]HOO80973.1 cytochrome c1 [Alphaproteobacteria bacterium]
MYKKSLLILFVLLVLPVSGAFASGGETVHPPSQSWSFDGPFGTFDRAAMQRGLKVYREVCSACHSLKRVAFRNLTDLGYSEDQVKAIAAEYSVMDVPDEEGEVNERTALPSDRFPSPYPNDNAAKAANNALPPDLSLITKARHDGPNYVYAILTGYEEAPAEVELLDGQHYNEYMSGHVIAMAPPLSDGAVQYEDGSLQTTGQYAHDVVQFLTWAAEPSLEARKRTGVKVLLFLLVFASIFYGIKKKIWASVH